MATYPRWRELTDAVAPSARWGGAGGFHSGPDAKRVVIWGGSDGSNCLNDTIEISSFDNTITSLSPSGTPPDARSLQSAFIDNIADPQRLITFAGSDGVGAGNYKSDLHQLTLAPGSEAWSEVTPTADPIHGLPPARAMAGFVFDAANYRGVLFGGLNPGGGGYYQDEWTLDLSTMAWTKESFAGTRPSGRARFGFVYDTENGRAIFFGGQGIGGSGLFQDLYALDLTSGSETWSALSPSGTAPSKRWGHAAIYDPDQTVMIVFGGFGSDPLAAKNDMFKLDLTPGSEAWSEYLQTGPSARYHAMGTYDEYLHRTVIHGGFV